MQRRCCASKCAKWSTLSVSVVVLLLGVFLTVFWVTLFQQIVNQQLSVANTQSKGFKMWRETPIPMYLEFHLFNWTNPDLVEKHSNVKPAFTERGPYVFYEHHIRKNITFNDNGTVTYLNKRVWRFERNKSVGRLDDVVTILNPVAIVLTDHIKKKNPLIKKLVNLLLKGTKETLSLQRTVGEVLFEGYNDILINIAHTLKISLINYPFKKFGWFVERNDSATYDGVFNMCDGGKDIRKLGIITQWNYQHQTSYYKGQCGTVNGTSGELWYAPHGDEEISIFVPDFCSDIKLHRNGSETLLGVEGNRYVTEADVFDNGTYYKGTSCFASGLPTGVRDVSSCKFGAPAYISLPHFYLADPVYVQDVEGMAPNPELHSTSFSLEPNSGIPVRAHAAFQLNLLMSHVKEIEMYSKVKSTMMPCFWFVQKAELSEELSELAKLIIVVRSVGTCTGYGLVGLGVLLLLITFSCATRRRRWKTSEEQPLLLNQESL